MTNAMATLEKVATSSQDFKNQKMKFDNELVEHFGKRFLFILFNLFFSNFFWFVNQAI
jgi:hypothetical protein